MKHIFTILMTLILFLCRFAEAEETIKVLMLESPYDPVPAQHAKLVQDISGKLFINGHFYAGSLEILGDENGLYVINTLPFEKYIEGVVAAEIGREWELEALKAQAVISRTFATYYKKHNEEKDYHLTSSVLHQSYKGINKDPLVTYAVKVTKNEILTHENLPVKAFFHASCEGRTEVPEEVWDERYSYLQSVDCNSNNAPYENWQRKFALSEIEKALGLSGLKDIMISSYTATGRVRTLTFMSEINKSDNSRPDDQASSIDSNGYGDNPEAVENVEIEVKATDLRRLLGYEELPSTQFSISKSSGEIIFNGKGYGHGVGLSQWGALEMAKEGQNYREILAHYYPGTIIKNSEELHNQELVSKK